MIWTAQQENAHERIDQASYTEAIPVKRKGLSVLGVLVLLIAGTAFVRYYNPFAPANIDKLLSREAAKMPNVNFIDDVGMMMSTRLLVTKKYEKWWRKLEDDMRGSGASDAEIRGVLATAHKHFSGGDIESGFIYGVPVKAKRVWVRFKPVWIIKFGWGLGYDGDGMIEPPDHVRTLAIEARKPYRELAMQTCG